MRATRAILPFFVLFSFLTFISCDEDTSCTGEISEGDINIAYSYNAYYAFFHVIESFNFEELASENILFDLGADEDYAIRYELNFPVGYEDGQGNSLTGGLYYYSKFDVKNTTGNQIVFNFNELEFNGIDVKGDKIVDFTSENELYWWSTDGVEFVNNDETTVFGGTLDKNMSGIGMTVTGTNILTVNNVEYEMEILEPIVKQNNCAWFTSGKIAIRGENTSILKFVEGCEEIELTLSNEDGCHTVVLVEIHNFW